MENRHAEEAMKLFDKAKELTESIHLIRNASKTLNTLGLSVGLPSNRTYSWIKPNQRIDELWNLLIKEITKANKEELNQTLAKISELTGTSVIE